MAAVAEYIVQDTRLIFEPPNVAQRSVMIQLAQLPGPYKELISRIPKGSDPCGLRSIVIICLFGGCLGECVRGGE